MIFLLVYSISCFILLLYGFMHLDLVITYWRNRKRKRQTIKFIEYPKVTIQLPLFNEKEVAERLVRNIVKIDYPKDRLQIQILDDSTDETKELVLKLLKELKSSYQVEYIHREDRTGYKAGALKHGLKAATGEFIAIFDADFLPSADWLKQTIAHFYDNRIGLVQTRWTHLNEKETLFTRAQALLLDYHFMIEQNGRYYGNHFLHFNGTAGIWRKKTILDAGNWCADTLTEDLDLSYRAQMKGWKINYVDEIIVPAEIPAASKAIRTQQNRWTKGPAQNVKKLFSLLQNHDLRWKTKLYSVLHLFNSSVYIPVLLIAMMSVPLYFLDIRGNIFYLTSTIAMQLSGLLYFISFFVAHLALKYRPSSFILRYILFIAFNVGISVQNSYAAIQGHVGVQSAFKRTPKSNNMGSNAKRGSKPASIFVEFFISIFLILFIGFQIRRDDYFFVFLHLFFLAGFLFFISQVVREYILYKRML